MFSFLFFILNFDFGVAHHNSSILSNFFLISFYQELGKDPVATAIKKKTAAPPKIVKLPKEELQARLQNVPFNANGMEAQNKELASLREEGAVSLFKSANLRTYPVSLDMLKQRTSLSLESFGFGNASGEKVSMDDFKNGTLIVVGASTVLGIMSLAFLPPNIGATLCYAFALIPILYLGVGSVAPAAIAQVIDGIKYRDSDSDDRTSEADRVARHEAAHFMCGYMCGLPIVDYNLLDGGIPCVEFSAGAGQRFSNEEVAALSITAMAGLVAEGMEFGNVKGAQQDLMELEQIFRKANDFILHDNHALQKLSKHRHNSDSYVQNVKEEIAQQERLLAEDKQFIEHVPDNAWDKSKIVAND